MGNFFWITLRGKDFELDIELKQTFCLETPEVWLHLTSWLCFFLCFYRGSIQNLSPRSLTRTNSISVTLNSKPPLRLFAFDYLSLFQKSGKG